MSNLGLFAQLACIWEATACKPGNVHRLRDFPDLHFTDFLTSAAAIGPVMERAAVQGVGMTVLEAIRTTRRVARTNTNLGVVLLLAPLAAVPDGAELRMGVANVLDRLEPDDAKNVFAAIRLAHAGGLARVPEQDVHGEPTLPLRAIMAMAAERDLVARQYAFGFREVLEEGVPVLERTLPEVENLEQAIIVTHVHFLANHGDSLILRKCGPEVAAEAQRRARAVLDSGWPAATGANAALADLDAWLCADGHARNPGTSADLVCACLFAALRRGIIPVPSPWPFSARVGGRNHHG